MVNSKQNLSNSGGKRYLTGSSVLNKQPLNSNIQIGSHFCQHTTSEVRKCWTEGPRLTSLSLLQTQCVCQVYVKATVSLETPTS